MLSPAPHFFVLLTSLGGLMKFFTVLYGLLFSILAVPSPLHAQSAPPPEQPRPLVLTDAISTPGLVGRFDHFGFDGKNRLFVAALGNNSVEVIDISARVRERSLSGIPRPQGV